MTGTVAAVLVWWLLYQMSPEAWRGRADQAVARAFAALAVFWLAVALFGTVRLIADVRDPGPNRYDGGDHASSTLGPLLGVALCTAPINHRRRMVAQRRPR